jgi:hypothetical protein
LLNLDAAAVHVVMTDPLDGIVYDSGLVPLSDPNGVSNFWRWLYTPISLKRDIVFLDMPMYANARLDVRISRPNGIAKCGVCATGLLRTLGTSDWGTSVGIKNYTKITEDDFGNRFIVRRSYSKLMNVPVTVPRNQVDYVQRMMTDLKDENLVWIASQEYESTIVFGAADSFEQVIAYWDYSRLQLKIQGLV